jgi:hypothetical protein
MPRGITFLSLALAVFVFAPCPAGGDDRDFSISRDFKDYNRQPRVAVNAKTGDVLVAWLLTDSDDSGITKVYSVLCLLEDDGDFVPQVPMLISDTNTEPEYFHVAYNPQKNNYVIVWDASTKGDDDKKALFARLVNASGKPARKINMLKGGEQNYRSPVIQYTPWTASRPPAAKGYYLLVYEYFPMNPVEYAKAGVYASLVSHKGKPAGPDSTLLCKPNMMYGIVPCEARPLELLRTDDDSFLLFLNKDDEAVFDRPYLARLDKTGTPVSELKLGDYNPTYASMIQLSKKVFMVTWDKYVTERDAVNQLFKPNLRRKKKEFAPPAGQRTFINELVKLEDDSGGYQLSSDGHYLKGRYISNKGVLDQNVPTIFDHNCMMQELDAACLPGANRIFIAWVEIKWEDWSEVKAYVFDPTIPD